MIQLIWGILNVIAFLGFLIFCVKKIVEIRQKIGLFVAILFSLFALSFISAPSKESQYKKFEFLDKETKQNLHHDTFFSQLILDDDLTSKIEMTVLCDDENAISAVVTQTGFISGTEWNTEYVNLNKTEKKSTYQYEIGGTRKWKILGIAIYSEFKQFKGTKELK